MSFIDFVCGNSIGWKTGTAIVKRVEKIKRKQKFWIKKMNEVVTYLSYIIEEMFLITFT